MIAASWAVTMIYIHQQGEWPNFTWAADSISATLAAVRHRHGCLVCRMGVTLHDHIITGAGRETSLRVRGDM